MFDEKPETSSKKMFNWQLVLFVVLAGVGLGAVLFGLRSLITFSNTSLMTETAVSTASATLVATASARGFVVVDVAGAVKEPGVYQLAVGSRLATAIDQAGGFSSQADRDYISQELNLAQKLKDGAKIYIFSQAEKEYEQTAVEFCQALNKAVTSTEPTTTTSSTALISLNNATAAQLESLEGVGEKRAAQIMAARPYQSLDELVSRKVISESLFGKIRSQLQL